MCGINNNNRKFNHDFNEIKRAAEDGPVFIANGNHPTHVLMTYEYYLNLRKSKENIVDLLAMSEAEEIDFEPKKLDKKIYKAESFD